MDTSFQLSFLAVLFIVWGLRRIQQLRELRPRDNLSQTQNWLQRRVPQIALYLAVPILATLGTGPVVTYHFGRLSLAGFLANPILVPIIGLLVVPLGFLIGFVCLFSTTLALPLLWIAKPLLSLTLWMVGLFSDLPMGVVNMPKPNLLELGIVYLVICSILVLQRRTHVYLLLGFLLVAVAVDGTYWWRQRWGRSDLRITYLSVGHGDAAVVEFPGSSVLLIDAGGSSFPQYDPGKSIVAPFLRSRRIAKVHYVLVSHPRIDHYGGMKSILEEFAPSEFWSGPVAGETRRYLELEETANESGVKRAVLKRSNSCREIGKVKICVLYPSNGSGAESSVVLRLTLGQYHFLFPGDINKKGEERLVGLETDLASQVLKVPRHGSLSANTDLFVGAVRPRLAIFSVGYRSPRSEVIARYIDAGSEVLRTDEDGAIIVETDGERLSYRTHLSGKRGRIP
jgi:competence protein ComEC